MGETNVQIRPMQVADLAEIQRIERQSFTTPWSLQAFFAELVHNDNAFYVVACQGPKVVGYVGVWIILDEGHITNVAVDPNYRGQGVGHLLMQAISGVALEYGVTRMTLEVRVSNTVAQGLYRKLGYAPVGVRPHYYRDNNEDALIMWKDLTVNDNSARVDSWNRDQL